MRAPVHSSLASLREHLARRHVLLSLVGAATLLSPACSTRPRTQVMVEVYAEAGVRARLTSVHLRAQGFDATGLEPGQTFDRDVNAPLTFPISLGIVPQAEDPTRTFRFEAVGFDGSEQVSVVRARSGFRAGQTLRLVLVMEDACAGVSCSALETCRAGVCVDATIDPATLLPLDSDASIEPSRADAASDDAAPDAFGPTEDAGVDAPSSMDDAGLDAPTFDAYLPPDTGDAGPCGLDTSLTYCPGEGACFDLLNDDSHCGSCDDFCIGGRSCNAGVCIFESTGAEGAFRPATSMMLAPGVHHFTVINIPTGVVITTSGTGVLDLRATGAITVNGTIDVSGGDGANGINPTGTYGGSGGGGDTGLPTPAMSRGDGCGVAGMGGEGGRGADGTPGGGGACTPGGGVFGGGVGGTWSGGGSGGGGHAGGGGGAGGSNRGGAGGASVGESGGAGGENEIVVSGGGGIPHGTGGRGGVAPGVYAGGDGVEAPRCLDVGWWAGGGGGGSIGRAAAEDLTVASTFRPGSGGGGGGSHAQGGGASDGGAGGGGGGGAIRLSSPMSITIGETGRVLADGGDGGDIPSSESSGAGGGGSGGLVYLASPVLTVNGSVSASGGAAGTNAACGADGGAGGVGRVRLSTDPAMCTLGPSSSITPGLVGGACSAGAATSGSAYLAPWPD
jgi:hypothetical protein